MARAMVAANSQSFDSRAACPMASRVNSAWLQLSGPGSARTVAASAVSEARPFSRSPVRRRNSPCSSCSVGATSACPAVALRSAASATFDSAAAN
jgi:hypothetical protein